ncbi:MAG: RnfH family protein [Pseudomonadota bacterium]
MKVVLVYSPAARQTREWVLDLPAGSKAASALQRSGAIQEFPELASLASSASALQIGIWGRRCDPDQVLQDGDRIEIYRKLRVDPKVARRERFKEQGVKRSGLFSSIRPGGKAGY